MVGCKVVYWNEHSHNHPRRQRAVREANLVEAEPAFITELPLAE
jgi:hypothetical protein